ncbi:MAG: HAMP domain-containing histidine kinase [Bdellovibrio sp.]|nr:HAMP domain-containing histidine kinase [Bdellovibrio sp.]
MISPQVTFQKIRRAQIYISIFSLVLFSVSSVIINYFWIKDYATQNATFIHRHANANDKREVGLAAQEAHLSYFTSITYNTTRPGGSFTFPPSAAFISSNSFTSKITNGTIQVLISKNGDEENILFTYNRFRLLPYAFALWILLTMISIPQIRILKKKLSAFYAQQLLIETDLARVQIANKVRHNIRTPLSVLISLSSRTQFRNQEEATLFQGVISQVQTLISELDTRTPKNNINLQEGSLDPYVHQAIKSIRETLPSNIELVESLNDCSAANTSFIPHELRSILENILNNAMEAQPTTIRVSLKETPHSISLTIQDNGIGIPQEVLLKISNGGFTYGKSNGSGLGLKHAREHLQSWNGQFKIESKEGAGTLVTLSLPITAREKWFVPEIKLNNTDTVVVIDDQIAVHRLWKIKLSEAGFEGQFKAFYSISEAEKFLNETPLPAGVHIFSDYDLGEDSPPGSAIFEKYNNFKTGALVTGHSDLEEIKMFCLREKIGLIPKMQLATIPILLCGL